MLTELLIVSLICSSHCWRVAVVFEDKQLFSGDILRNIHGTVKRTTPSCLEPTRKRIPSRLSYNRNAVSKWTRRSSNTIGAVSITNNNKKIREVEDVIRNLESLKFPYVNATNTCSKQCHKDDTDGNSILSDFQAIIDEIFSQYILKKTIVLRGYGTEESPLALLLGSSGFPLLQLHLHSDIENPSFYLYNQLKEFCATWNMPDNTDDGRLMIILTPNKVIKDTILMLVRESMSGTRSKLLIMDDPHTWDEVLSNTETYVIDITVITEIPLCPDHFPLAVQLRSKTVPSTPNITCYRRDEREELKSLGKNITQNIKNELSQCCVKNEKLYYLWRGYPSVSGTVTLQPIATWSKSFGLSAIDIISHKESMTLRVAIKEYRPVIKLYRENNKVYLENSMCKAVLDYISKRMNISYELLNVEGDWGSKENGSWNGAIKMILNGEADVIPFLALTTSRNEALDFTHPLLIIHNAILTRKPEEPPRAFLFLRPFQKSVWFGIIICLPIVSFAFYVINRYTSSIYIKRTRYKIGLRSFINCFWYIFGATLQQGGIYTPDSISGRMIAGTWWLSMVVIFSTYSGNLIAFLTFPEAKWVVENIRDIIDKPKLKIYTGKTAPVVEEMERSTTTLMKELHEQYAIRGRGVKVNSQIKKELLSGNAIYMDDIYHLLEIINNDFAQYKRCRFSIPPYRYYQLEMSVGMRRGSPYFRTFNRIIKELWETGMLAHWHKKYSGVEEKCEVTVTLLKGGGRNVELKDLQGAFYLLCLGLMLSMIALLAERISRLIDKLKLKLKEKKRKIK